MLDKLKGFDFEQFERNQFEHGNYVNSTRRIFHIHADKSEELWNFKDLYYGSYGTGTIIKKGMKYFLLTAKHVLKDYLVTESLNNTSPFRVTNMSDSDFSTTDDFLFPKKIWKIGKIIPNHELYDFDDVVLVELFNLEFGQPIDHYIDFDKMEILSLEEYENLDESSILADVGFAETSNPYFFDGDNRVAPFDETIFTSSTLVQRNYVGGQLRKDKAGYYFKKLKNTIECTNGMSGGLILYMDHSLKTKVMGMHIRGSKESEIIRFLPMCKIHKAIGDYLTAESVIIDYCYYERLAEIELGVGGIAAHYDDYLFKNPDARKRNHDIDEEYFDDLTDFALENKEFILVSTLDYVEVHGDRNKYELMLIMMNCFERAKEQRIKEGRP